jgi:hypothetical protein
MCALVAVALVAGCGARPDRPGAPEREAGMQHEWSPGSTPSAPAPEPPPTIRLPDSVGLWTRFGEERRVDPEAIFAYMDGAGELYLGYRFDHLTVVEYRALQGASIQVELYFMHASDDAFGLLSFDWGGEPVAPGQALPAGAASPAWPRALYGGGLLRLWAGPVYARIMAAGETADARHAVLSLADIVAAQIPPAEPPGEVSGLPAVVGDSFALRRDSVCFLRSHLVLNQAYYLSQENLLDLDPGAAAVTARFDRETPRSRVRLVAVSYPTGSRASAAAEHFRRGYLPEAPEAAAGFNATRVEAGWVGMKVDGRCLALALDCPDAEVARALVAAGEQALVKGDGCHE